MKVIFLIVLFLPFNLCLATDMDDVLSNISVLFSEKQYKKLLDYYPISSFHSNKEFFYEKNFDMPYIYSICLYATGEYSNSLDMIKTIFYPKKYNIGEMKFFNYLMLNDYPGAEKALKEMENPEEIDFYKTIYYFSKGDMIKATNYLISYLSNKNLKSYYIEALLIDYCLSFRKESLNFLILEIKKSWFLKRYEEKLNSINSEVPSSPLKDFITYRKIVEDIKENKIEMARQKLLNLIKTSQSEVVKNLASYEYQKL